MFGFSEFKIMTTKKALVVPKLTFEERMEVAINRLGGLQEACKRIKVADDTLTNWKKGKVNPNYNGMKKLAELAGISLDWLTFDEYEPPLEEGLVTIPYLDLSTPETRIIDGHDFAVHKDWSRAVLGIEPEKLAMIMADSDSMLPTIISGDIVLLDTATTAFTTDAIYLFRLHNAYVLRRVQTLTDGTILLKPDNPAYREESLSRQEAAKISVAGMVKWIGKRS